MELTLYNLAKEVAEKALNEITYEGKTLREWIDILAKQQTSEDCVSRDAMMKCFKKWQPYMGTRILGYEQELSKLPSVTPSRPRGKWIKAETKGRFYCSICGGIHDDPESGEWREVFDFKYPYCPNCGADMKNEDGELHKVLSDKEAEEMASYAQKYEKERIRGWIPDIESEGAE